jgi:hypothetical protein
VLSKKGKRSKNKNPNSPSVSQRSTPAKTKARSGILETRKTPIGNLNDGNGKDSTKKKIEETHVVPTSAERKRETRKIRLKIPEIEESPCAMDVDEVIK